MLVFRADIPEEVARKRSPRQRRPLKKAARPIGATLGNELRLKVVINKIIKGAAQLVKEKGLPEAQSLKEQLSVDHHTTVVDSVFGIAFFGQQLRRYFDDSAASLPRWLRPLFEAEEEAHRTKFVSTIKNTFAIDLTSVVRAADVAPHLDTAMINSVNQITGITDELAKRVQTTLMQAGMQGKRADEIGKQLSSQFDWSLKRSKLIARDQMATFNGALNKVRQTQVGFDKYIWSTSQDERVREDHAAREGKVYSWDDPPEDGHPGEAINCRCVARAYVDTGDE